MDKNVKVYFEESGDIRRFVLRGPTALEQHTQLLETIVPFLNGKTGFSVFYKDEENDFVTLSTAQEFEVCAACPNNRDILRIYVRKSNAGPSPSSAVTGNAVANNNTQVWPQVTCDRCSSSPLHGIRYKCTVCPDYDECGKCFNTSPQHQHAMIALTDPHSDEWKLWGRRALGRHFLGPHGCGPHGHRHRGMHGVGETRGHSHRRHGRGDDDNDTSAAAGTGRSFAEWLELAKSSAAYAQQQLLKSTEPTGMTAAGCSSMTGTRNESSIPGVSFTTCEGGHPKVEVDVDMNDLIKQPKNVFETVFRAVEEAGKMFQSMAAPVSRDEKPLQQQTSTSSQTTAPAKEDKKEGTSDSVQQQDVEMRDNATVVVDVSVHSGENKQPHQQAAGNSAMSTSVQYMGTVTPPTKNEPTAPPAGWTLLAADEQADRKKEMDDMINACTESMKDLGFDTEKPWIRDLIKGCQGNLSRVMDELTPGANLNLD